jgi:hypothetical protein
MGFLLAKMLFLLIVAAAAGALLAWWWFRRHYEDVTFEYARAREEWERWRDGFEERLAARPEIDLRPLLQQLVVLEQAVRAIEIPPPRPTDLTPVLAALAALRPAGPRAAAARPAERIDLAPAPEQLRLDDPEEEGLAALGAPEPSAAEAPGALQNG